MSDPTSPGRYSFVDDDAELDACLDRWSRAPWLALDTEFLREDTYFPKLCLIQVGDGRRQDCVDTLALAARMPEVLAAVSSLAAEKVFHAASQDLEIFVQLTGRCPLPLFDTQLAAALLGYGDQLGYAALIDKLCGVTLDKSLTRTQWSRRPLTSAELDYAAADVYHLGEIYPRLRDQLRTAGRLEWLREDCLRWTDPARYRTEPADAWRRLKGFWRLPEAARPAAAALADWREQVAIEHDRPRRWILDDDALYRLAERRPRTLDQLVSLTVLPAKSLSRHGVALIDAIEAAVKQPAPAGGEMKFDEAEKKQLKTLAEAARERAEVLNIPVGLLAPRTELEMLLRLGNTANIALLRGWRREVAGEELLRLAAEVS